MEYIARIHTPFPEKFGIPRQSGLAANAKGTPIYDIKPYLPYADAHPDAKGGFADSHQSDRVEVDFPSELLSRIPKELQEAAIEVLAQDPRAAYNKKPDYIYGMAFDTYDIRFVFQNDLLTVTDVTRRAEEGWKPVK